MLCVCVCASARVMSLKAEKQRERALFGKIENTFSSMAALVSPRFSICMRDSGAIILQRAVIHDDKLILFKDVGCAPAVF